MGNPLNSTQYDVVKVFGAAPLDNASLTMTEWDTRGLNSISVIAAIGNTATAVSVPTVFTLHASDTTGFTPGAGNKIGEITAGFPTAARTAMRIDVGDIALKGRYVKPVLTVGNGDGDSDIVCIGIGNPEFAADTAARKGLTAYALVP